MSKAFEDAYKSFLAAYQALEVENAVLRDKVSFLAGKLAQYEADAELEHLVASPTKEPPPTSVIAEKKKEEKKEEPEKKKEEEKKKEDDKKKPEETSKFRAVKDFLFKSKPKVEDELAKKSAAKDDGKKNKSSSKNKLDRWNFFKPLEGHTAGVVDIARCEYDALMLGSASRDGVVRLWNLETATCGAMFTGHKGTVNSIHFHPNSLSRLVCTAGSDGTIQTFRIPSFMVHNQRSPALMDNRSYQPDRESPVISPDGSDGDLVTPPHTPRSVTPRGGSISAPTVVPPVVDPVVSLPVVVVLRDHTAEVVACDWIAGASETLVSGSKDSTIRVWDVTTQQSQSIPVQFPNAESSPHLVSVSAHPSQPTVLGPGSDGLCRVWDLRETKLSDLISHSNERSCGVTHALFSRDGGLIFTGGDDRLVKLWDARNTSQPLDAIRCGSVQTKFSLSLKTNTLVIPMRDSKLKLCDTQGYNVGTCETHKLHKEGVSAALWSDDETHLYTASFDDKNNLAVWARADKL